jgi:hypothetical protein
LGLVDVRTQTGSELRPSLRRIAPLGIAADSKRKCDPREPVVRAESVKAAIAQLRDMTKDNADRSSRQALAANLMHLRTLGVDEEMLDLVVEMVLAQNVDEEMTAAINYLASGFLLALLTFREEAARAPRRSLAGPHRVHVRHGRRGCPPSGSVSRLL